MAGEDDCFFFYTVGCFVTYRIKRGTLHNMHVAHWHISWTSGNILSMPSLIACSIRQCHLQLYRTRCNVITCCAHASNGTRPPAMLIYMRSPSLLPRRIFDLGLHTHTHPHIHNTQTHTHIPCTDASLYTSRDLARIAYAAAAAARLPPTANHVTLKT